MGFVKRATDTIVGTAIGLIGVAGIVAITGGLKAAFYAADSYLHDDERDRLCDLQKDEILRMQENGILTSPQPGERVFHELPEEESPHWENSRWVRTCPSFILPTN